MSLMYPFPSLKDLYNDNQMAAARLIVCVWAMKGNAIMIEYVYYLGSFQGKSQSYLLYKLYNVQRYVTAFARLSSPRPENEQAA